MIKPDHPRKRSPSDVRRIQTVITVTTALRQLPNQEGTTDDVCIMSRTDASPLRVLQAMEVAGQLEATRNPHKPVLWRLH